MPRTAASARGEGSRAEHPVAPLSPATRPTPTLSTPRWCFFISKCFSLGNFFFFFLHLQPFEGNHLTDDERIGTSVTGKRKCPVGCEQCSGPLD